MAQKPHQRTSPNSAGVSTQPSDTSLSSTSTLDPAKLGPALKVQVISQPQFVPEGLVHSGIYLFAGLEPSPADVPADLRGLVHMAEYRTWAQRNGGVPAQTLAFRMTVRAAGRLGDASSAATNP